jgi:two-component system, LytTR family, response regulator LytT
MKLKCLIVEDEPIAQDILKSYLDKIDFAEVAAQMNNAIEAFNFLKINSVDLLFLDIKMPQMTGLELLKALPEKPKVVITSAYRDYAIDAFDLDVIDYLLKPYSFERFRKAVNKALHDAPLTDNSLTPKTAAQDKSFFFVKGNKQLHKIYMDEITFIESQRDYLKFTLVDNQEIMTRQTLGYYEQFLPAEKFIRIHRSFIVATDKIKTAEANRILITNRYLPVGRNYKLYVLEFLKTLSGQ